MPLLATRGSASVRGFGLFGRSIPPPTITVPPTNQTVSDGASVTFSVTATGVAPLTYQWRRNGSNISGATSSSYTFTASTSDAGSYTVVVSNVGGSTTSTAATLTVNAVAPTITSQPVSGVVGILPGSSTYYNSTTADQTYTWIAPSLQGRSISVSASGTEPKSYQWRKNGVNISGATSGSYFIPADPSSSGDYTVVVSNSAGSVTSNAATVTFSSYYTASILCVGAGGAGNGYAGGGGGALAYGGYNFSPGQSYTVVVGGAKYIQSGGSAGSAGGKSYFVNHTFAAEGGWGAQSFDGYAAYGGPGGYPQVGGGGQGGAGGTYYISSSGFWWRGGGGGAGGYTGQGGWAGSVDDPETAPESDVPGQNGNGGGGAGGVTRFLTNGRGGGGVGMFGQGASGLGGYGGGGGGSGGNPAYQSEGGSAGGGAAGASVSDISGQGGVRIIWGAGRSYPSTNTASP